MKNQRPAPTAKRPDDMKRRRLTPAAGTLFVLVTNFTRQELKNALYGDPGIKDIFTATNGQGQYRRYSTKEWRSICGTTRRLRQQQRLKTVGGITETESNISTSKTASSTTTMASTIYTLQHLPRLTQFYGQARFREDRFFNYSSRRKL